MQGESTDHQYSSGIFGFNLIFAKFYLPKKEEDELERKEADSLASAVTTPLVERSTSEMPDFDTKEDDGGEEAVAAVKDVEPEEDEDAFTIAYFQVRMMKLFMQASYL